MTEQATSLIAHGVRSDSPLRPVDFRLRVLPPHFRRVTVTEERSRNEFDGLIGDIVGARNLTRGVLPNRLMEINALKNKAVTLINYSDKRSINAAALLCETDFCDVGVLHDGMKRWNQNGLAPRDRFEGQLNIGGTLA